MTYRITAKEDHEIDEAYSNMETYRFQRNRLRDAIKKAIALIEAGLIIEAEEHLADTLMKNGATRVLELLRKGRYQDLDTPKTEGG